MPMDRSSSFMTGSVNLLIISTVDAKIERFLFIGSWTSGTVSSGTDSAVLLLLVTLKLLVTSLRLELLVTSLTGRLL